MDTQAVKAFETFVNGQKILPPKAYDEEYFVGNWREDKNNDYTLEKRREIEGKNPFLIKEVFKTEKVLDVGCGPGALMALLDEGGVYAEGVDFSEHSITLAPETVRVRIMIANVSEMQTNESEYDLVVCREVMEHLTVRQVYNTVKRIVKASKKYIYITTRFHPSPSTILDITTEFDVDPTHITLMTKDMLRAMFILEGCKTRHDLESQMDWLNKGRCLVMEKV